MSENKFELIIENGVVTGYKGQSKVVEIPEGVTEIGEFAFQDCKFVEEVHSNSTVLKTIGMMAFENCKNLKVCKLKALKGSIEDNAFSGCEKLKSFVIPNGTIKIGSCAFDYCKELLYLIIPSSVFVIEGYILEIGNKKTVILGDIGSEAEEYAKSKMLPFKENTQATRNEFLQLENKKDNTGYKDFNIFGETVRCYKSILIQEEIVSFFEKLSDDFKAEVFKCVPKSVNRYDREFVKLSKLSELYVRKTRDFLQRYGVFINDTVFMAKTMEHNANYITICRTLVDTYCEIVETVKQGEANIESSLIAEAESKITGLDYGIIGTRADLFFHAIDEYRAEKRQRKEAYAVANSKMQSATSQMYSKAEKIYIDFLNHTALPSFYKAVEEICNGLMNFAVEEMIEAKVIDKKVFEIYDVAKSNKLIEQAKKNSSIDKKYAIAVALKLYPLNSEAIVLSFKEDLIEKNTFDLIEYLELHQMSKLKNFFHDHCHYISLIKLKNKYATMMGDGFAYTINEIIDTKAGDLIDRINKGYDPMQIDTDTWNSLVQKYTILYSESVKKYNITEEEVKGPNGRELLSKAIFVAREEKRKAEEIRQQKICEQKLAEEKRLEKERQKQEERVRLAELKKETINKKHKQLVKITNKIFIVLEVFLIAISDLHKNFLTQIIFNIFPKYKQFFEENPFFQNIIILICLLSLIVYLKIRFDLHKKNKLKNTEIDAEISK